MKKLAVLISGVPRGNALCMRSLTRLVRSFDATFFFVAREEFVGTEALTAAFNALPDPKYMVVVPSRQSEEVLELLRARAHPNLARMWHEIYFGFQAVKLGQFDLLLRTRPDVYFGPGKLSITHIPRGEVLIPETMSFSGVNDIVALGRMDDMAKYCSTYHFMLSQPEALVSGVPEFLVASSLRLHGISVRPLHVDFCLYRHELLGNFSDEDLAIIATNPLCYQTGYKIGANGDTPESRQEVKARIRNLVEAESGLPLLRCGLDPGNHFYCVESDRRDNGKGRFRFFHGHASLWRDFDVVRSVRFKIYYWVNGLDPSRDIHMNICGIKAKVEVVGADKYGRLECVATPHVGEICNHDYRAKIGFFSAKAVVPAEVLPHSQDRRRLSAAIGDLSLDAG